MPVLSSSFSPPRFLRNGHLQTILPVLLPRRLPLVFKRERLELSDGDFLDLHWSRKGGEKLVILSHGLEGNPQNGYIRGMAAAVNAAGWDALAWSLRGCGEESNRLARFYHSGETGDLSAVIRHAAARYCSIVLIGFSLGGNITLKYLGEGPAHPTVCGGIAISTPVDLASSARALDQRWANRVYTRRFLKTLIAKVEEKAARFPDEFDIRNIRSIESFREFDDRYTARLHGFRDAMDYWTQSSARPFLGGIRVPALLLNARNDPFLTAESFPETEASRSDLFYLEAPESGGHVGFLDLKEGLTPWSERRAVEFLVSMA